MNNGSSDRLEAFFKEHPKRSLHSLYPQLMVSPRGRVAIFLITHDNELIDISFRLKNGNLFRWMESRHLHMNAYRNATILERFQYKPWHDPTNRALQEIETQFLNRYPPRRNSIRRYVTPETGSIESLMGA